MFGIFGKNSQETKFPSSAPRPKKQQPPQIAARLQELEETARPESFIRYMRTYTMLRDGGSEYMEAVRHKDDPDLWLVQKRMTAQGLVLSGHDPAGGLALAESPGGNITSTAVVHEGVRFFAALKSLATYQTTQPTLYMLANMRPDEEEQLRPGCPRDARHFIHVAHRCRILFDVDGDPVATENGVPIGNHDLPETELALFRDAFPREDATPDTDGLYWQAETETFVRMNRDYVESYLAVMEEEARAAAQRTEYDMAVREARPSPLTAVADISSALSEPAPVSEARRILLAASQIDWDGKNRELAETERIRAEAARKRAEEEQALEKKLAEIERKKKIMEAFQELPLKRDEALQKFDAAVRAITSDLVTKITDESKKYADESTHPVEGGEYKKPETKFFTRAALEWKKSNKFFPVAIKCKEVMEHLQYGENEYKGVYLADGKLKIGKPELLQNEHFENDEDVLGNYASLRNRQSMVDMFNTLSAHGSVAVGWAGNLVDADGSVIRREESVEFLQSLENWDVLKKEDCSCFGQNHYCRMPDKLTPKSLIVSVDLQQDFDPNKYPLLPS